ncbi:MAG: hypothetical protein ABEI52_04770, partial [Halobacteriaceae archaeon]
MDSTSITAEVNSKHIQQVGPGEQTDGDVQKDTHKINATIPVEDLSGSNTANVSLSVSRDLSSNPVFDYIASDPALFPFALSGNDHRTMLLTDRAGLQIYISSTNESIPKSASQWVPVHQPTVLARDRPSDTSVDTVATTRDGTVVAYSDGTVYGLFTNAESNLSFPEDPGIYFDENENTYHMYYESGNTSGFSGTKIGHATTSELESEWTVHDPVYQHTGEYQSGDYAMVERNGIYFLFGDYT